MPQKDFETKLQWGQIGESAIACWLRSRGWTILPVYEKEIHNNKGPRLFTAFDSGYEEELVATDMLAMKGKYLLWTEAKRKTHFTWRRKCPSSYLCTDPWKSQWQTGIDLRHYHHYLQVRELTSIPLWLLFLHEDSHPSPDDLKYGCPSVCPTGLFGGEITYLHKVRSHEDGYEANGRNYPMVYWNRDHLASMATLEEVQEASKKKSVDMQREILRNTTRSIAAFSPDDIKK